MKSSNQGKDVKTNVRHALLPRNIKTKDEAWSFAEDSRKADNKTMAVNAYTAVIRWDPDHVQALQQRCLLHMKMKKYAEADVDAFRLQQLLPTSAVGYQLRGRIYISTEQYGKASFEFQLALSVEPDLQVLKLKEWADKLMTLSLQRYATETSNREAITGEEPSTSVEYLHTVLEAAKICGGNISPQAAALYVDVVPSVATFSTTSCVVEEELEKHSEAAAVTADQAAAIASAAKWPIGDEVDPHDCAKSSKCIQHTYVRVLCSEDEHVPHVVNLVKSMPGGRQEVKRYYERNEEYINSEAEEEDEEEAFPGPGTAEEGATPDGASPGVEPKGKKKKKPKGKGAKGRHNASLAFDAEEEEAEEEKTPTLFHKECDLVIGAAWNYIKYELGTIEVGDHAVVFEVDDVLLSSYPGFKATEFQAIVPLSSPWIKSASAPPISPVLKFYSELRDHGATLFILTSRPQEHRDETEQNLLSAGYGGYEQLIMRPELDAQNHVPIAEYKSRARAWISRWYTIIMTVGCQECDLTGCSVGQPIKLPNNLYIIE